MFQALSSGTVIPVVPAKIFIRSWKIYNISSPLPHYVFQYIFIFKHTHTHTGTNDSMTNASYEQYN